MRILIANHVEASLLMQADQRAFVQRIFWFARDHDLVILPSPPDQDFLAHVASLTGLDSATLKIHNTAAGAFEQRLFDPETLLDETLLRDVAADAGKVSEIFALWPSPQVAEFAARLGLSHVLPGAAFFAQQGGELANNKGNFRAFATAVGMPVAEGAVCRTREHAVSTLRRLLAAGPVMVKQAHNHAGNGNELVVLDEHDIGSAGAIGMRRLRAAGDAGTYFEQRWEWASAGNCFPVIVERFQEGSRTVYAEFRASDAGVAFSATGALGYKDGKLVEETIPLRGVSPDVHARLVHHGSRLAQLYQSFGYRGCLSADAVVNPGGDLLFTEMNARVGASLHLYEVIGFRIVDVWRAPQRSVVQYVTGADWRIPSLPAFLKAARELGLAYDTATRKGVIVTMAMAGPAFHGGFLFCVAYEDEGEARNAFRRLEERFTLPETERLAI
jgi:biotin carboxylase